MTPGKKAPGLEIAEAIPTSALQRRRSEFLNSCQVCWRIMRWQNGRSWRSRNLYSGNAQKGSVSRKDEGAAHSIQARRSLLHQRPNTFAQTNSVSLILRFQNGGGPYIPELSANRTFDRSSRPVGSGTPNYGWGRVGGNSGPNPLHSARSMAQSHASPCGLVGHPASSVERELQPPPWALAALDNSS